MSTVIERVAPRFREALRILAEQPDGLSYDELWRMVCERMPLSDVDLEPISTGMSRTENLFRWCGYEADRVGWLTREHNAWRVTDEGISALSDYSDPLELVRTVRRRYREWAKSNPQGDDVGARILSSKPDDEQVLEAARLFVERGFARLDSVFTPGLAVWNRETVDELHRRFVENPDTSGSGFMTKLRGQIGAASDAAIQLTAELLALNLLPVDKLSGAKKRERLATVLGWRSAPIAIPAEIDSVLNVGCFAGGVSFNIQVWIHLAYLITALRRWHEMPQGDRRTALEDPWAWKAFVMDAPGHTALAQRNSLLYLVHPETFLPIVSDDHKRRIRNAFAEYLDSRTGDIDRDLLQITLALQAEEQGPVQYYRPPLLQRWRPTEDEVVEEVRRAWFVRGASVDGRNLVPRWLSGNWVSLAALELRQVEPGISRQRLKGIVDNDYGHKSYAVRETKLQEFDTFLNRMKEGDVVATSAGGRVYVGVVESAPEFPEDADRRSRLRRQVTWQNARHPARLDDLPTLQGRLGGQADVIDVTDEEGLLAGLLEPVEPPRREVRLRDATDELARTLSFPREWLQELVELLRDRRQLILYGPPGTGKTYVAKHLARHLTGADPSAVKLVQFHPSYSYEDFFEGYRPVSGDGNTLAFKLQPGPLRRIVDTARDDQETPYVLVIDEINRANIAKVFGELYFLLEYRDESIDLQYSAGEEEQLFSLPPNVFLVGTMNTADRSIALVDTALRRRFAFCSLHPADEPVRGLLRRWLADRELPDEPARLLDALNAKLVDRDFAVGPSYFMRPHVYERPDGLERVWRTEIMPLLEELYYGEEGVAERFSLAALRQSVSAAPDEP